MQNKMLEEISYYQVFGIPLIAYGGILTLISLMATAAIASMNMKGINRIPMEWHFRMAKISMTLAIVHGLLGIAAYL